MRFLFKKDTIKPAIFVIVFVALVKFNPLHFHLWEPAEKALEDFDYTDIVFANIDLRSAAPDTDITIVNIEMAGRKTIDSVLHKISAMQPKVIGLDVVFAGVKNDTDDRHLANTIAATPDLVIADILPEDKEAPHTLFAPMAHHTGYVNFSARPNSVVRCFSPFNHEAHKTDTSFTAAILHLYRPEKFDILMRHHDEETLEINYTKDSSKYLTYNYREILYDSLFAGAIKDRIVLIGYYSTDSNNIEDKHTTPANKQIFGKSLPDMHGIHINANILSMMLSGSYIHGTPKWASFLIAAIVIWLFMGIAYTLQKSRPTWREVYLIAIEIALAMLLTVIMTVMFTLFKVKVDLGLTIACIPVAASTLFLYDAIEHSIQKRKRQMAEGPRWRQNK